MSGSDAPPPGRRETSERLREHLDPRRFPAAKRSRFLVYLAVGALIALSLRVVARTAWGEGNLNWAFDRFILDEAITAAASPASDARVAFIDIDYENCKAWGDPLFTPRDRIARMIRAARLGAAKVILLDVLFEYPDYDPRTDAALRAELEAFAASTSDARLVFPVRLDMKGMLRRNLFDDLIDAYPDRFFRGLPSLSATPDDRVVRHWKLFGRYHPRGSKEWRIIWGTPFLGAVLAAGALDALRPLEPRILARAAGDDEHFTLPLESERRIRLSPRNTDYYLQRIRFHLIPPGVLPGRPEGNLRPVKPPEADALLDSPEAARAFFEGRVVVVGVSNPEAGDVHSTPIGDVPGLYIMGNSVDTVLSGEQPLASSGWSEALLEALAVLLGAYVFVHLPNLVAQLALAATLLSLFGGASLWYFKRTGVFLNFVFPMIGMQALALFREVEELVRRSGDPGPSPAAAGGGMVASGAPGQATPPAPAMPETLPDASPPVPVPATVPVPAPVPPDDGSPDANDRRTPCETPPSAS